MRIACPLSAVVSKRNFQKLPWSWIPHFGTLWSLLIFRHSIKVLADFNHCDIHAATKGVRQEESGKKIMKKMTEVDQIAFFSDPFAYHFCGTLWCEWFRNRIFPRKFLSFSRGKRLCHCRFWTPPPPGQLQPNTGFLQHHRWCKLPPRLCPPSPAPVVCKISDFRRRPKNFWRKLQETAHWGLASWGRQDSQLNVAWKEPEPQQRKEALGAITGQEEGRLTSVVRGKSWCLPSQDDPWRP